MRKERLKIPKLAWKPLHSQRLYLDLLLRFLALDPSLEDMINQEEAFGIIPHYILAKDNHRLH